jgi:Ni,Fe-hydrogenase I cytochrome b subunit
MRKKISVIVLAFYIAAVLAESVNTANRGLDENADFSGSCEQAKSLEKGYLRLIKFILEYLIIIVFFLFRIKRVAARNLRVTLQAILLRQQKQPRR